MNLPFVFLLLLFGHVIGDFYLQSLEMAKRKNACWKYMAVHGLIYTVCMAAVLFFGVEHSLKLLWLWLFIVVTHIAVDITKGFFRRKRRYWKIYKKIPTKLCRGIYKKICKKILLFDQLTHLVLLVIAWCIWGRDLLLRDWTSALLPYFSQRHFVVLLGVLIILRPVGLLIANRGIWGFNRSNKTSGGVQEDAGKMIGYLERIIVFFLLVHGQYTAISFVIAAKSIMRFPEINDSIRSGNEKNKSAPAEYYLIGTLLSMASVFVVALLLGLMEA